MCATMVLQNAFYRLIFVHVLLKGNGVGVEALCSTVIEFLNCPVVFLVI
jgi:hypothetical protein